jgi:hypothetical protein
MSGISKPVSKPKTQIVELQEVQTRLADLERRLDASLLPVVLTEH